MIPSFAWPASEDVKVPAFARDARQVKLPTTIKLNPKWFQIDDVDVLFIE